MMNGRLIGRLRICSPAAQLLYTRSKQVAATLVGWAAISTSNGSALAVAQATTTSTTVQSWLASRGIPATANTASNATVTTTSNQVVAQPNIRTRSSR